MSKAKAPRTRTAPSSPPSAAPCCPPLDVPGLSEEDAFTMAAMFKALGDPVRLRLFSRVASHPQGEACVCDISDVGVSQPTVSHHLRKLREVGLLVSERRGTWIYHRVAPGVLAAMAAMLPGRRPGPLEDPEDPDPLEGPGAPAGSGDPGR